MIQINNLLKGIRIIDIFGSLNKDIKYIDYDSRNIKEGSMFFAINGFNKNGNKYIPEALKNGAKCIVSDEKPINKSFQDVTWVRVKNCRCAMAIIADNFYGHPSGKFNLIGITGTNGKTTTTWLADSILTAANYSTAMLGTIKYRYGGKVENSNKTTPEATDLQKIFSHIVRSGTDYCVFEVSSHSLSLDRVKGCEFEIGVFTNLSHDHLDFHKTEEKYFQEKLKLFTEYPLKKAIVNIDDKYGKRIIQLTTCEKYSYGIENNADVVAEKIKLTLEGVKFTAKTPYGNFNVKSKLLGMHNVYNMLAALCIGLAAGVKGGKGINLELIKDGIEKIDTVPGRFELIDEGQDFVLAVDYAHTDDALKRVLILARKITTSKVITVFGCGGNRDKSKRFLMGKVAALNSDFTVITSDNPRYEKPHNIIKDIEKGILEINNNSSLYVIVENRKDAIEFAIKKASKGDVVIIAGKGHEDYQILGNKRVDFDDREVAREALKCLI